jgi:hypothetical protein
MKHLLFVLLGSNLVCFGQEEKAFLKQYCLSCHSTAKQMGEVDLERLSGAAEHARVWQQVAEQLRLGEMPPKGMPRPKPEEVARMQAWIETSLLETARLQAGDPGPVVLRRLNNAEYTFTLRDLTGVSTLEPAKEFPADGAAGEGFTNTGNSLAMSPALVRKYLDAAKEVARRAVLLPDGIEFSASTSSRDWTNEKLDAIRSLYRKYSEDGGAETVTQQGVALDRNRGGAVPLRRYLKASYAVRDGQPLAKAAQGLSEKYLAQLVAAMQRPSNSPLWKPLQELWRKSDTEGWLRQVALWQSSLFQFQNVGHIGKLNGPKHWMEPITPIVARQTFRQKLEEKVGENAIKLYLTALDAGDGKAGDSVVWREPKLTIPGRPPVLLKDVQRLAGAVSQQRDHIIAGTAAALGGRNEADPIARKAWNEYLGIGATAARGKKLEQRIERVGTFDFIQGWGGGSQPAVYINRSETSVRIPGNMKARTVALLPTATHGAVAAWVSPLRTVVAVDFGITRAHTECGVGIFWRLELQRGGTRLRLAEGPGRGAQTIRPKRIEGLAVEVGDVLALSVSPRDGNASCSLTAVDYEIQSEEKQWSLTKDLAIGNQTEWQLMSEAVAEMDGGTILPTGSLLARWQTSADPKEKQELAQGIEKLLRGPAPKAEQPDGMLYRQLTSLAGPLAAGATEGTRSGWGLDPARFVGKDLKVASGSVTEVALPAEMVLGAEFSAEGEVENSAGSVQLRVTTTRPSEAGGLIPTGAAVQTKDGAWTSNNQSIAFGMPVIAAEGSATRKRFEAYFEEFRQLFPASLCYTKIVPVDEVVTMTLFHREDSHLARLMLTRAEQRQLDRLWEQLYFVSKAPLLMVDTFEQLWQFATQDADPSQFEPLRKPIQDGAARFREQMKAAEPKQVEGVVALARRAYRRPLTLAEKEELRALYATLLQQQLPHVEAIQLTIARVLTSPSFLYRTEKSPAQVAQGPVSNLELANRLSYFLWSSQPDEELRKAAELGSLRTAVGMQRQLRRMIQDPKIRRLALEFGTSWLQIRDFDSFDEKSEKAFPSFQSLRGAMYEESVQFLTDFFASNGSVLSLLDADSGFLNDQLAQHYGIAGVVGPEWRKVTGLKQNRRGGILGQGAILSKQAGASRTSPILRGNWISEVLLGDKLPRPPKDVPQLPEEEAGLVMTMRELTEKHTSDARCSGCHRRIDPYGYALEEYDAIGRWRNKDLGNRPIHTKTKVMDGSEFEGLDGLRQYLLTQGRDAFVKTFCRKLLGYALGRAVQLSDEPLLSAMQTRLGASGYKVQEAMAMIVASKQFREIRGRDRKEASE